MKVIIKHDLKDGTLTILNMHSERTKCIEAIQQDIRNMQDQEEDEYKIMLVNRTEIHLYEKGIIYGKSLICRYVVDEYCKDIFKEVVKEIEGEYIESEEQD